MEKQDEKKEASEISEFLALFIRKNRKIILTAGIAVVVAVVGFVVGLSIFNHLENRAFISLEGYNERYEALRFTINEPEKEGEVTTLLEDLAGFAAKTPSFAGARAYGLIAAIHADKKNWAEAESNWKLAADRGKKTYFAPIALYNAGVAAEERGGIDDAITYYTGCIAYAADFPGAPRAQFAIGRLREEQRNTEAALESYRAVIEKWPSATIWTNLANSRILVLSGNS
jgi:tetratricopeptide (TPR) repeat protein